MVLEYCLLPNAYCLVPITYYLLPIAYCLVPITYWLLTLPIAYYLLPIAMWLHTHKSESRKSKKYAKLLHAAMKPGMGFTFLTEAEHATILRSLEDEWIWQQPHTEIVQPGSFVWSLHDSDSAGRSLRYDVIWQEDVGIDARHNVWLLFSLQTWIWLTLMQRDYEWNDVALI
jgi:hypothetical protein